MKGKLFFIVLTLFMILVACQQSETEKVIVETTSGHITVEDLNDELQKRYGTQVLEELVMESVLSEKYDIDDEMVDAEIESLKEAYGEGFDLMIQQQGFDDLESFKDILYLGMLQEEAALDGVEITDEQLEELYERKTKEISAQHILIKDEATAQEILDKIDSGKDFGELAKEYSEDAMSAKDGGDLGYFSAGTMVAPFEDVAFTMDVGEISDPVQTNYGYHIIKLNDVKDKKEDIGEFEDIKENLEEEIISGIINDVDTQIKVQNMIESAIVEIKDENFSEIFEAFKDLDIKTSSTN